MKQTSPFSIRTSNIRIGWLYPELMSTYGDRGNITVLKKRCEWRGINVVVTNIDESTTETELKSIDLLFGGGSQTREQEIVIKTLWGKRAAIKTLIEKNVPALFVCGSPQLMGSYYESVKGERFEGLGLFDLETKFYGPDKERLIGNLVAEVNWSLLNHNNAVPTLNPYLVGFENHSGRTRLGPNAKPLAKVIKGFGNNGEDGTEGVIYRNAIGTYLHGPLLPKNPQIADWLIAKVLEIKYKKTIELKPLDDTLEEKAKSAIAHKLGVTL